MKELLEPLPVWWLNVAELAWTPVALPLPISGLNGPAVAGWLVSNVQAARTLPDAELPNTVHWFSVNAPSLQMPPPLPVAEFPARVQRFTVRFPRLRMAPPALP